MTLDEMIEQADARTLNTAGNAFADRGMWNESIACYERALERYRQAADRRGEALTLNNLGATHYALGDWDAALGYYREALALLRGADDRRAELLALINVCFLLYAQGGQTGEDLARAQRLAEELGADEPLTKIYWMRGDAAFSAAANLPQAFHQYALACRHAARAGGALLDETVTYIDEHLRVLVGKGQRLAALAFCDHLLAFGRTENLGRPFIEQIDGKRTSLLAPPLLG